MLLHLLELRYKLFIDGEVLYAVGPWRLVLMVADTLTEEVGHLEVWIAEKGRDADNRRDHLCIERTTTVADKYIRLLSVADVTD